MRLRVSGMGPPLTNYSKLKLKERRSALQSSNPRSTSTPRVVDSTTARRNSCSFHLPIRSGQQTLHLTKFCLYNATGNSAPKPSKRSLRIHFWTSSDSHFHNYPQFTIRPHIDCWEDSRFPAIGVRPSCKREVAFGEAGVVVAAMAQVLKEVADLGFVIAFRFYGRYPETGRSFYHPPLGENKNVTEAEDAVLAENGRRRRQRLGLVSPSSLILPSLSAPSLAEFFASGDFPDIEGVLPSPSVLSVGAH